MVERLNKKANKSWEAGVNGIFVDKSIGELNKMAGRRRSLAKFSLL